MAEEFKRMAKGIVEKCNELADMLEELVGMMEEMDDEENEDMEGVNIDLQQVSECLEEVYGIREVFDGAEDMTLEEVRALATAENPIVRDDDSVIAFADGSTFRKFGINDLARRLR